MLTLIMHHVLRRLNWVCTVSIITQRGIWASSFFHHLSLFWVGVFFECNLSWVSSPALYSKSMVWHTGIVRIKSDIQFISRKRSSSSKRGNKLAQSAMHGPMRQLGPPVSVHSGKCTTQMVTQSANLI